MYKLIGKSACVPTELTTLGDITEYCEIQLMDEFTQGTNKVEELYQNIIATNNIQVLYIHTPLPRKDHLNIEYITNDKYRFMFDCSFELAEKLAGYYKRPMGVIIHTEMSFDTYERIPLLRDAVTTYVKEALEKYPNTYLCFENVTALTTEFKRLGFRSHDSFANVDLVKHLRNYLGTTAENRIFTVLDTCHMLTDITLMDMIKQEEGTLKVELASVFDYFKTNLPYLKLVHLADVLHLGLKAKEHGIAFDVDRLSTLEYFIFLIVQMCDETQVDVTIEIKEPNYQQRPNLTEQLPKIKHMLELRLKEKV